jgi:PGF-CTERM protein
MKNKIKFLLSVAMLSVFGATICLAAVAGPTFGEIISSPAQPAPLSTVTLSITLSGETPSEVKIWVQECNERTGVCYPDTQNVTMSLDSAGTYKTEITLTHADATYIDCQVWAKTDGIWSSSAKKKITFSENANGSGGNGENQTPGFEAIVAMIALIASAIIVRRKRVK